MIPSEPWSRVRAVELAAANGHDALDLSLGVPDERPPAVCAAPAQRSTAARYPTALGSIEMRLAAADYLERRFGVRIPASAVAACAGAKEFVATLPSVLRTAAGARAAERNLVLIPELGYPPYEFGVRLAGLEAYRVPVDAEGHPDLVRIPAEIIERALFLWINSPSNPTGSVIPHLEAVAAWGRRHGVLVCSDEAYAELTWTTPPRTVLSAGLDGVLAVHSLAKRSNVPGLRVGFIAGDPGLVDSIVTHRRAAGLIAAEDSQRASVRLLNDDEHAAGLRRRTADRLAGLVAALHACGLRCSRPAGGPFVWLRAPGGDGVRFAWEAAAAAGLLVTPGIEYGPSGRGHVRLAAVTTPEHVAARLARLAEIGRLAAREEHAHVESAAR